MPRFYFHLRDNDHLIDEEGIELPTIEAARQRATKFALHMAAANVLERSNLDLRHRIELTDENGQLVEMVQFGDVVTVR